MIEELNWKWRLLSVDFKHRWRYTRSANETLYKCKCLDEHWNVLEALYRRQKPTRNYYTCVITVAYTHTGCSEKLRNSTCTKINHLDIIISPLYTHDNVTLTLYIVSMQRCINSKSITQTLTHTQAHEFARNAKRRKKTKRKL